ncbi:MAG: glycoside hydrolase family 99-like domain-containing protein [Drouetiella hepatica Uher 2000/2452]|jgi:lipopolysaccharide biosynthesis protein|uniref:Glycoside hydrolase family 99-like domain-containing protein n=1 Tax=Drouetiella hepatica Uher 2000/2452 TaxID=904376 RepID=A0A951QAG5_9CYAN|nr:glycoside hydrolase family 99-like domain-containing protein [Drouetiella hepatica Uher 2000/2452]
MQNAETIQEKLRCIAFYLPQYHPIPENDKWWGKGFTEWTNVTRAKPLFPGHYQPHLPADLGFYDLRLPEARHAQADLAKAHGVEGFCYYHYWFNGKRLLERPFNDVLSSGKPDLPFCLCWANEVWSRRWLGEERDILQKQAYSAEDDLNHIRWLMNAFSDSRYIQIKGRPLFLIYRPLDLPEPKRTIETFKSKCVKQGLPEPYLVGVDAHRPGFNFAEIGFDSTLAFEPQLGALPDFMDDRAKLSKFLRNLKLGIDSPKLKVYDYLTARRLMLRRQRNFSHHPCIFVSWDNTARRGQNATIIVNAKPEYFEEGLLKMVNSLMDKPYDERLLFINAWNEWAEGNHLEPDLKHGTQYLEAVKRVNHNQAQGEVKCQITN